MSASLGSALARAGAAAALASVTVALARGASAGPRIEVRGTSHFDVDAAPSRGALAVSGALLDDAEHPISGAILTVTFVAEDGMHAVARPCDGPRPETIVTGADGTFCARADARGGRTQVTVAWPGSRLLAGARADLAVDPSRRTVRLTLDPEPYVIPLGEEAHAFDALATATGTDGQTPAEGLRVRLADERGVSLGEATTNVRGRATIVVPSGLLGPPGPCELRLSFGGDARDTATSHVFPCERRSEVVVKAARVAKTGAAIASEEDHGVRVDLTVLAAGGPLASGSVEAMVDGAVVGAAPVERGVAHLIVPLQPPTEPSIDVRYVPEAPWYVAGPKTRLVLDVERTEALRRVLVIGTGAVLLAGFVASRRPRQPRPTVGPRSSRSSSTAATAYVEVVQRARDASGGWEGVVLDAHDRIGVPGALVTIERVTFGGAAVLASAVSSGTGQFRLPPVVTQSGDRLIAEGAHHARIAHRLPPRGVIEVALISRRRNVLRRFVDWARARGAPFDVRPDPTPEHVRRVAGADVKTALWAKAVEVAAFGASPVDAAREAELEAPPDVGRGRDAPPRRP